MLTEIPIPNDLLNIIEDNFLYMQSVHVSFRFHSSFLSHDLSK
jgi:hypothetical protein